MRHRVDRPLLALLIGFWALLSVNIGASWFMFQDNWQVWVPTTVQYYYAESFGAVNGLVTMNMFYAPGGFTPYTHHPPLITWLPFLTSLGIGENEVSVRFVFVAVTWLSGVLLYVIARRLYGVRVAFWALFFYALTPMVAYFGKTPGHDQIGYVPAFLAVALMIDWLRAPRRWYFYALSLCMIGAAWSAWSSVFYAAALLLVAFFLVKGRQRLGVVLLLGVLIAACLSVFGFYQTNDPNTLEKFVSAFAFRTSSNVAHAASPTFTLWGYLERMLLDFAAYTSPALVILAAIGVWMSRKYGSSFAHAMTFALFLGGAAYLLVFRNAAYIHNYYKMLYMPSVALLAGMAWVYWTAKPRQTLIRASRHVLIALVILWGSIIFGLMHSSARTPALDALLALIRQVPSNAAVAVIVAEDQVLVPDWYALEFYAQRAITPSLSLAAYATTQVPFLVYCTLPQEPLPDTLTVLQSIPLGENSCHLLQQ